MFDTPNNVGELDDMPSDRPGLESGDPATMLTLVPKRAQFRRSRLFSLLSDEQFRH